MAYIAVLTSAAKIQPETGGLKLCDDKGVPQNPVFPQDMAELS